MCGAGRKLSKADSRAGRPGHRGAAPRDAGNRRGRHLAGFHRPLEALHRHGDRDRTTQPRGQPAPLSGTADRTVPQPLPRASVSVPGPPTRHRSGATCVWSPVGRWGTAGHVTKKPHGASGRVHRSPDPGPWPPGRRIRPEAWRITARKSPWTWTSHALTHSIMGGGGGLSGDRVTGTKERDAKENIRGVHVRGTRSTETTQRGGRGCKLHSSSPWSQGPRASFLVK